MYTPRRTGVVAVNRGTHRGEGQRGSVAGISRMKCNSLASDIHDRRKGRQCSRDTGLLSVCLKSSREFRDVRTEQGGESGCVLQRGECIETVLKMKGG